MENNEYLNQKIALNHLFVAYTDDEFGRRYTFCYLSEKVDKEGKNIAYVIGDNCLTKFDSSQKIYQVIFRHSANFVDHEGTDLLWGPFIGPVDQYHNLLTEAVKKPGNVENIAYLKVQCLVRKYTDRRGNLCKDFIKIKDVIKLKSILDEVYQKHKSKTIALNKKNKLAERAKKEKIEKFEEKLF